MERSLLGALSSGCPYLNDDAVNEINRVCNLKYSRNVVSHIQWSSVVLFGVHETLSSSVRE